METSFDKCKNSGMKPFYMSLNLFVWLIKTGFHDKKEKSKVVIPWFALFFIVAIGFNSLGLLEEKYQPGKCHNSIYNENNRDKYN